MSIEEKLDAVFEEQSRHCHFQSRTQEFQSRTKSSKLVFEKQLGTFMEQKQKMHEEPTRLSHEGEEEASNPLSSSSEDEPVRRARIELRFKANSNDLELRF